MVLTFLVTLGSALGAAVKYAPNVSILLAAIGALKVLNKRESRFISIIFSKVEQIEKALSSGKHEELRKTSALQMQQILRVLKDAKDLIRQNNNKNFKEKFYDAGKEMLKALPLVAKLAIAVAVLEGRDDPQQALEAATRAEAEARDEVQRAFAEDQSEAGGDPLAQIKTKLAAEQEERGTLEADDTDVLSAAYCGHFWAVAQLLKEADASKKSEMANTSGKTYTLVHQAIFWSSSLGLLVLLDNGANVDSPTKADDETLGLPKGSTPLHLAVATLNVKLVRFLIARGASMEARNAKGQTPLDLAQGEDFDEVRALFADPERVKTISADVAGHAKNQKWSELYELLNSDSGADPNMKFRDADYYALHQAAFHGDSDNCIQLIAAGALTTLRTAKTGLLPSQVALSRKHGALAKLLQDAETSELREMKGAEKEEERGR